MPSAVRASARNVIGMVLGVSVLFGVFVFVRELDDAPYALGFILVRV